ncbi:MAG: hypothetical protein IKM20_09680 [Erysipelotrichales bacterium]|nr:hypothetical protein [Erysipelotrichales bacterium]
MKVTIQKHLDCECSYCKNIFKTDIKKVLFFRKIQCPKCENVHSVVENMNEHGTLPGYIAALMGVFATFAMERGTPLFISTFIVVTLVSYFLIRYYLYGTKKFKVYLTKWYR